MNKLLETFSKLKNKWLDLSRTKQIVIGVLIVGLIAAITIFGITSSKTKYGVLFSNMDANDSAAIITKLKSDKVEYKVDSSTNTIYVPENKVDDLRLQYATSIKGGSVGFELFDNSSQLGMTDQQFNVQYQRALEGEMERTIKGFPQIDNARVQIVMPDNSVFVRDGSPAKASVFLKMKPGQTLTKNQVKAIVSLVSGGVKNLSPNDVQVVDDNMTLLSSDLNNSSNQDVSATTAARSDIEGKEEQQLQEKVLNQLVPIYGRDNVKVQVNADMNFDSTEQNSTAISNPTVISEHNTNDVTPGGTTAAAGASPTNNNVNSNQIVNNNNNNNGNATHNETIRNYDTNRVETKTEVAPGNINRLTVSVVVNEANISANEQASINNIVNQAVGINQQRGDSVSIEGMRFDTTLQNNARNAMNQMNQQAQQQQRMRLYTAIGIGAAAVIAAIAAGIVVLVRRRRKAAEEQDEDETTSLDAVIDDTIVPKEQVKYDPIDFEQEDEKLHVENEVKKYASTKPDQVADVVKAWISENER